MKAYCTSSSDLDQIIDKNIGTLDQIWGDEVFTRDLTTAHSKLISYLLFINLFKTKYNEGSTDLVFDKTVYSFVTDKLQLDHMEAQNPVDSNMAKHFSPADPHELREKYVDSLGNFMILDNENNNEKNNKPLVEAMCYYDNMCADHWLIKEAKFLLNAYHKSVNIDGVEFSVPTEKFFNERASRLRTYFEKIIVHDLDAKKVTVWH